VAPFTKTQIDPYKNFKFRVKFEGSSDYVAGVSNVSALERTPEVIKFRDEGDDSASRESPGRTEHETLALEHGLTHDIDFERWANKVWDYNDAQALLTETAVSHEDFRKDITIEVFNEAGQKVISYQVFRCWVSEYQALPDLDGNANAVVIQHITLENEGWVADSEKTQPADTGSDDPNG